MIFSCTIYSFKCAKLIPGHKKEDKQFLQTTCQFHYYNYLKKWYLNNSIVSFKRRYYFIMQSIALVFELVDRIIVEMDKLNTPISIFRGIIKDLDTLDHHISLKRMEISWFKWCITSSSKLNIYPSTLYYYCWYRLWTIPYNYKLYSKAEFLVLYIS